MKRAIVFGFALLACVTLFPCNSARADDEEKLLGDTSREARFKIVMRESIRELGLDISILSTEILKRFSFPSDADDESIYGIDLSHHNEDGCRCEINWTDIENQKVTFAYLKATQGATGRDARFADNWNELEKTRILRGAYHFLSPFSSPEDQVQNFLKTMGPLRPHDLPPVMDIEWTDGANPENDGWKNKSSDEIVEIALKWLTAVEAATGRTPVIYTSRVWWRDRITDAKLGQFERYPIWLAQYVPESAKGQEAPKNLPQQWTKWAIWQFTESGGFKVGLQTNVDVSVFKGPLEKFHERFGVTFPAPPVVGTDSQKPDTPTDASLPPGGTAPSTGSTPGDNAAPAVSNTPSGPASGASAVAPKPDASKDANLGPPSTGSPATGSVGPGGGASTPKERRDPGYIGLGGNPEIRME
jgi:lysozyme